MTNLKNRIDNFINLHPSEKYKIQYVKGMNHEDVMDIFNKYIIPIFNFDDDGKSILFNKLEKSSNNTYRVSDENSRSWYLICMELAKILYVDSSEDINVPNSVDALVRLNKWDNTSQGVFLKYKDFTSVIWSTISKDKVNLSDRYFIP